MRGDDTAVLDRAAKTQRALDPAADGAKAMAEYEAERKAVEANTVRLRALRLERERAEQEAASAAAAAKPKAASRKARAGGSA